MTGPSKTEPWRVGVLFSKTGCLANIEYTQFMGTMVAIDEINDTGGINGREVVPVSYDPSSDNALYRDYSRQMLVEDGLSTIFGCYTSSSRKAVLPIVERMNGLLWYPTLYEGFEFSPNVIYSGSAPNQNSVALADYLTENFGPRVFFVGSDYVFPAESNRIMRHLLTARGSEIVGERYVPLRARRQDFLPVFNEIRRIRPDAIFSTVVGDATTHFYRLYADLGISPRDMPIFSLTTTETEVAAMGGDVAENHFTAASYFQALQGEENADFLRRSRRMFGDDVTTNVCMEAAYYQVMLFRAALELADTVDTDLLRPAILGVEIAAPQGTVGIHSHWGHSNLRPRIGRAMRNGQFEVLATAPSVVETDPFFVQFSQAM
ncbi:transporter substrate-binding domain-containing protein [Marinibacterium sp. SX1]|uniref:transporter substrate-binding domain-containing protein n=1 Tax=Marinibacterium sp. SX1 TaxID=3388424 RepID=UPI003D16D663